MAEEDEIIKILEEGLGFGKYETSVLLFLLRQHNYQAAKQVAEGADVPLTRVYSVLEALEKQELVSSIPGKTRLFISAKPEELSDTLLRIKMEEEKKRQREFEQMCAELKKKIMEGELSEKERVDVRYYVRPEDYWPVRTKIVETVRDEEKVMMVETGRPIWCQINDDTSRFGTYFKTFLKKSLGKLGTTKSRWHLHVNPDMITRTTFQEFKGNKTKVLKSLKDFLEFCSMHRDKIYLQTLTEFQNFNVSIMHDTIFLEFYPFHCYAPHFFIALEIKNKKMAMSFSGFVLSSLEFGRSFEEEFERIKKAMEKVAGELLEEKVSLDVEL